MLITYFEFNIFHGKHYNFIQIPFSDRKYAKKDNDPPLRLLDDLFRKTKATPCIYWLPLTPEQVFVVVLFFVSLRMSHGNMFQHNENYFVSSFENRLLFVKKKDKKPLQDA